MTWMCFPRMGAQVDLTLEIIERKTGGLSAGGGISATGAMEGALPGVVSAGMQPAWCAARPG